MQFLALQNFTRLASHRVLKIGVTSSNWSANTSWQEQGQCHKLARRTFYTHMKETGIPGYDKNRKMVDSQRTLKHQPSWLENCRCVDQEMVEDLYRDFNSFVEDLMTLESTADLALGNQRLKAMAEHIIPWVPIMAGQVIGTDRFYVERARRRNQTLDKDHKFLTHKLAWAIEMISRHPFGMDDMTDSSDKRNDLACWYTLPGIGLDGMNDYATLITGGFLVLEKHFASKDYYPELVRMTMRQLHITEVASNQLIELKVEADREKIAGLKKNPAASFKKLLATKSRLNGSVLVNLPIVASMIMHGITDPEVMHTALETGCKVIDSGIMVDDCVDCFGEMDVVERTSTDIQTGRQTWLLWKAMELGNAEQCQILEECYGKDDEKCVAEVKKVYNQLNIKKIVEKMAEDNANEVEAGIRKLPQDEYPCYVWLSMLDHYRDVSKGKAARP